MPALGQDGSHNHDGLMLSEQRQVAAEERGEALQMVGLTASSPRDAPAYGQSSGTWSREGDEEEDDLDVDENSELNRHRRPEANTSSTGINRNGDGGESGHHAVDLDQEDEKSFRYYKELPNYNKLSNANKRSPGFRAIGTGLVILAGLGYLIAYLCTSITRYSAVTKANVILMVSDGYGPASETFARSYLQHLIEIDDPLIRKGGRWAPLNPAHDPDVKTSSKKKQASYSVMLPLDTMLIGQSRTRSSDSLVTDSAAGATAFSCAMKSYNRAIAVEPKNRDPCGTVLEAAKHQGYRTGLAVTSRITHATPAAFYAHVPERDMESTIAEQMISTHPLGSQVDVAFGGGLCFFLPNSSSHSCRIDDQDLIKASKNKSNKKRPYKFITSRSEFDALPSDASALGTIGLFGDDHLEYEIDRWLMADNEEGRQPPLEDMAIKAIDILQSSVETSSAHGFFLMIEGSRIDMAAHGNDPVGHVHEILSYQATVKRVMKKVDQLNKAGTPTVIISVSDHETGGLALAYQLSGTYPDYAWYPDALTNGTSSAFDVARRIRSQSDTLNIESLRRIIKNNLGVSDPDDEELASILRDKDVDTNSELWVLSHTLAKLPSRRAQVGWSTEGHSGVDVNLYGYPRSLTSPYLGGNRENTEIGEFIAQTMKLDLKQITKALSHNMAAWYQPESDMFDALHENHTATEVQHYHGQHRH